VSSVHGSNGNVDSVGGFQRGTDGGSGDQAPRESDGAEETRESKSEGRALAEATCEPVKSDVEAG